MDKDILNGEVQESPSDAPSPDLSAPTPEKTSTDEQEGPPTPEITPAAAPNPFAEPKTKEQREPIKPPPNPFLSQVTEPKKPLITETPLPAFNPFAGPEKKDDLPEEQPAPIKDDFNPFGQSVDGQPGQTPTPSMPEGIITIPGEKNILVIAPHAKEKDNIHIADLVVALATQFRFYAVINKKYEIKDVDLDYLDQIQRNPAAEKDFLEPINTYIKDIIDKHAMVRVVLIYGMADKEMYDFAKVGHDPGHIITFPLKNPNKVSVMIGYGEVDCDATYIEKKIPKNHVQYEAFKNYMLELHTADEGIISSLIDKLDEDDLTAMKVPHGHSFYDNPLNKIYKNKCHRGWYTNQLNQYFFKPLDNSKTYHQVQNTLDPKPVKPASKVQVIRLVMRKKSLRENPSQAQGTAQKLGNILSDPVFLNCWTGQQPIPGKKIREPQKLQAKADKFMHDETSKNFPWLAFDQLQFDEKELQEYIAVGKHEAAPRIPEGGELIAETSPANFDIFVKLLKLLPKGSPIIVRNGIISQVIGNGRATLYADVGSLFNNPNVNLSMVNAYIDHKKLKKILKQNNNIYIFKVIDKQLYEVNNNIENIVFHMLLDNPDAVYIPDLTGAQYQFNKIALNSNEVINIRDSFIKSSYVDLLVQKNNIDFFINPAHNIELESQLEVPPPIVSFKSDISNFQPAMANNIIRSYSMPLIFPGYDITIKFAQINNLLWMVIEHYSNFLKFTMYEQVNLTDNIY